MIRKSTTTALLTLVALGAFSAELALAKGKPTSLFTWTGPLPALVLVLSDNLQVFRTQPEGFAIICQHFGGHGLVFNEANGKAMTAKDVTIRGTYSKCIASGSLAAEVTTAEFLVNADGSVSVVGQPIVITIPGAKCSIKIANEPANHNLRLLLFLNQKEDLLVHVEVSKIRSLGSGVPLICGSASMEKPNGSYTGLLLVRINGGILQWQE